MLLGTLNQNVYVTLAQQVANHIVISEVYGGGGNKDAPYSNDFVELYNPTNREIDLKGWKVDYSSATGSFGTNNVTLTGTIKPYSYYLIQCGAGNTPSTSLPVPDESCTISLGGNNGKVKLVDATSTTIDFVGYGTANESETSPIKGVGNTLSASRKIHWVDTDDNANDFVAIAPNPQNNTSPQTIPDGGGGTVTSLQINHTPITRSEVNKDITIRFETTTTGGLAITTSSVFYLVEGESQEKDVYCGDNTVATIPANDVKGSKLQYYITTTDGEEAIRKPESGYYAIELFNLNTVTTIADARKQEIGKPVTLEGLLIENFSTQGCYMQDTTGGIQLYDKLNLPSTLKKGDKVRITGKTGEFNTNFQLVDIIDCKVIASNQEVAPQNITINQIGEAYEGELIQLKEVVITGLAKDNYNNALITLTKDGKNQTAKMDSRRGGVYENIQVVKDDIADVVGIVEGFKGNYTIQLRDEKDIEKTFVNDTKPPIISHTMVAEQNIARNLNLEATVTDERLVKEVKVYYQVAGATDYTAVKMVAKTDEKGTVIPNTYVVTIPKSELKMPQVTYYIEATDGMNTVTFPADKAQPLVLNLITADIDGPTLGAVTPADGAVLDKEEIMPLISATFEDQSPLAMDTLVVKVDEQVIDQTQIKHLEKGFSYQPATPLTQSKHKVEVTVADIHGNKAVLTWQFTIGKQAFNHYKGQLHSHTGEISDGTGTLDEAYTWARDKGGADYFAVTDHSNWFDNDKTATLQSHSSEKWAKMLNKANEYNKNGEYVAIAGYEMTWSGSTGGWGHMNTFNTDGFYSRSVSTMDLVNYYKAISEVPNSISQLNHPGKTFGDFGDFGFYNQKVDDVVHLIEVGNGEGPVHSSGYFPSYEYYTRALDKGWHVAPSNNQDNHKGNWITSNDARTVVLAQELTRESIYQSIRELRVYATEDKNLEINYYVNGNPMGTIMEQPEKLQFSIQVKDEDVNDQVGKISIIANGGTVVTTKTFDSNTATWNFELDPSYSYYYVRIEQPDKDIAVTAPVWIGEVVPVGLAKVVPSQSPTIVDTTIDLTASAYNNGKSPIENVKVEYYMGNMSTENKIGESIISNIGIGESKDTSIQWKAETPGSYTIYAATTITYGGIQKRFSVSERVEVKYAEDVMKVVLDASHQNQYVSGDYAGKYNGLKEMLTEREMILVENRNPITQELLKDVGALIITAPQRVDKPQYGLTPSKLGDSEIEAIAQFVKAGGNLILASRADYGDANKETAYDYQTAVQFNKLLEVIGSNMRINDDQVIDNITNGGQAYRLSFNRYTSSLYHLTPVTNGSQYSFYSGSSVVLKEGGDSSKVDWLVKGHETTEISDADKAKDFFAVAKGQVNAIGAEDIVEGGKVVVAGSTFFSDFEVTGDDLNSNRLITEKILEWMQVKKEVAIEKIAAVRIDADKNNQADRLGQKVAIEGTVMAESEAYSKVNSRSNAFFETIYVQDETGGITVFGISKSMLPIGTKVRIIGRVDEYQGDTEVTIVNEDKDLIILDEPIKVIEPKTMKTGPSMLEENEGWLVKVTGKVTKMEGNSLFIDDGSGVANIFVEGYIGNATGTTIGKWDPAIRVGDTVSAIGFCSEGLGNENRLRVRNTSEIIRISEPDKPSIPSGGSGIETSIKPVPPVVETQEKDVEAKVTVLTQKLAQQIQSKALGNSEKHTLIGIDVCELTMKKPPKQPVVMKVDLAKAKISDTTRLTAVRYVTDEKGNVSIQKIGGIYNEASKEFTFFTSEAGQYSVVETEELSQIQLWIGKKEVQVNNEMILNDCEPIIEEDRTMVPIRLIIEQLGAEVKWNETTRTAIILLDGKELVLTADEEIEGFGAKPIIQNNRMLVPIRYITESCGGYVLWFPSNQQILIVK